MDFGHHDMSFIKYLKEVPGIHTILGVDIETIPLRCSSDLLGGDEYSPKRESPLKVTVRKQSICFCLFSLFLLLQCIFKYLKIKCPVNHQNPKNIRHYYTSTIITLLVGTIYYCNIIHVWVLEKRL